MQRIIVTGAAGFAGCNLVEALLEKGYFVYAIVRPDSLHNKRLRESNKLKIVACEMADYADLSRKISTACDVFYHLAWQGRDCNRQMECLEASLKLIETAVHLGCKRFVGVGSQAEYGPQIDLITEETLPQPITAYGTTKLATCLLTRQKARELGIEWLWGRIFSLYGKYEPRGRMLPDLIYALRGGASFKLSAATQMWDYLHSEDGAEALIALGTSGRPDNIYNIANGDYHPLRWFAERARELIAPDVSLQYGEPLANPTSLQVSVAKIYRDTGWKAKIGFLEKMNDDFTWR